jgi:bacterioferritin (cytochrome b1)
MAKLNKKSLESFASNLSETLDHKNELLSIAEDRENPNEERIDLLEEQLRILEDIGELIQEYLEL